MSNSKLVSYTRISPNSSARTHSIDRITIHHMGSTTLTLEMCGAGFASTSRKASSNYGVGTDGRIALYVDESRRSWCSSNWQNDDRAVTIEVQNDSKGPDWHISDIALEATIKLCVDICQRNGIKKLTYTGDTSGNLTMHKWFASTMCPGPYLSSKFPYIADEVNKRLGVADNTDKKSDKDVVEKEDNVLSVGDTVSLINGAKYTTDKSVPSWVLKKALYVRNIKGNDITVSIYKTGAITGVVNRQYIKFDESTTSKDESIGAPSYTTVTFAVGDVVKLSADAKYTTGKNIPTWVMNKPLYVRQIYSNGDIVISIYKTGSVTGTVSPKYLIKI